MASTLLKADQKYATSFEVAKFADLELVFVSLQKLYECDRNYLDNFTGGAMEVMGRSSGRDPGAGDIRALLPGNVDRCILFTSRVASNLLIFAKPPISHHDTSFFLNSYILRVCVFMCDRCPTLGRPIERMVDR